MEYFHSCSNNLRLAYAIGCLIPSLSCVNTAPRATPNAFGQGPGLYNIGSCHMACFSCPNASWAAGFHLILQGTFELVKSVRGTTISEKCRINLR